MNPLEALDQKGRIRKRLDTINRILDEVGDVVAELGPVHGMTVPEFLQQKRRELEKQLKLDKKK